MVRVTYGGERWIVDVWTGEVRQWDAAAGYYSALSAAAAPAAVVGRVRAMARRMAADGEV